MANNKKSFEDNLSDLQQIVEQLQQGDVPLEQAMAQFQKGVALSQQLEKTLMDAEEKLTQVINEDGTMKPFQLDDNQKRDSKDED